RRQWARVALHDDVHGEPGVARALRQAVDASDPRGPLERLPLAAARRAEQLAKLGKRLAAGAFDQPGGVGRSLRIAVDDPSRGARLNHHHAEVVSENVVKLARNAPALLGDGSRLFE